MHIEYNTELEINNWDLSDLTSYLNKNDRFSEVELYVSTTLGDILLTFRPSSSKPSSNNQIYVDGESLDLINRWAKKNSYTLTLLQYSPTKRGVMITLQRF